MQSERRKNDAEEREVFFFLCRKSKKVLLARFKIYLMFIPMYIFVGVAKQKTTQYHCRRSFPLLPKRGRKESNQQRRSMFRKQYP